MIPAISETTQGPETRDPYFANLAIDNDKNNFINTLESTEEPHWWKAEFKTTVYITKFIVFARIDFSQRIDNIKVFTVLYNTRVGQGAQTEEHLLADLGDIPITAGGKTFEVTNGVMSDALLLKRFRPSDGSENVMNIAEIYICGY